METVYIALGSNKGNRVSNIIRALKHIEKKIFITSLSPFIEFPPEEGADGGFFINGVLKGRTRLSPEELFEFLQDTEEKLGRKHPHKRGDERKIDLDIIFYGDREIKRNQLTVPHQSYRKRFFVLKPLCEIAPDFVDPETGKTVFETLRGLLKK